MLDFFGIEIYVLFVCERYFIVDCGKLIYYWKIKVIVWFFDCVGKKMRFKEEVDLEEKFGNVFVFSNLIYNNV